MKAWLGLGSMMLMMLADAKVTAQGPQSPISAADSKFALHVPAPGPSVHADEILQQAIDQVAAAGGGTVVLGAGDFKLSRRAGEETVVIKSNITLRGQGYATHIYLDPKTPPNELRYYPMRIGTAKVPASHIVIENLRYTGNDKAIGGGSIMGFNARLDEPESLLLSCDHITVRNCWIYDAKQAVGCTKPAGTMYLAKRVITPAEAEEASKKKGEDALVYTTPERLAAQFKNWQVHHNMIDTCGNKAVELAECNGGLIADNYIVNTVDGPQVIFGSRNVRICDNHVTFTRTGINITEGSHHIVVSGNVVEPAPGISPKGRTACLVFRTEPLPLVSTVSHVTVTGNVFRNQTTDAKVTMRFETRKESLGCTYEALVLTGNIFDGDLQFHDRTTPALTTVRDILFADNLCEGLIQTLPAAEMKSSRVTIKGNTLRNSAAQILQASHWIWAENFHTAGRLEVAPNASANILRGNITASPIVDGGVKTLLQGNLVSGAGR